MIAQNRFQTIQASGAKFVELPVGPNFTPTEINEAFGAAYSYSNNLTGLPGVGGGPFPKAGTQKRQNWLEYAAQIVETYGPNGSHKIKNWEIWNEPNMPHEFATKEGETEKEKEEKAEYIQKADPKDFALFFKEMADVMRAAAVKGANKEGINILAPGLYGYRIGGCHPACHQTPRRFLKVMNEQVGANAYDAISLHPYVFKIGKPHHQHGPKENSTLEITEVTKLVKKVITGVHKLSVSKPIWVTELGFPVANPGNKAGVPKVAPAIQKFELKATFSMMQNNRANLNIAHAFYYNIQDINEPGWEYHSGLLELGGEKRPAWNAYQCLAEGTPCP